MSISVPPKSAANSSSQKQSGSLVQNILAGLITSLLQLAYAFSFGGLIFDGSLSPFLANGVAISLVTAIALGGIISWRSGFKSAIAGPDTNTATFQAAMMVSLEPLISKLPQAEALSVALTCLLLGGISTGVVLFILGRQGMGRFIRYIPFPVVAGFLASTGWLMAKGALKMVTGTSIDFVNFVSYFSGSNGIALSLTIGWSAILWILTEKIKSPLLIPATMIFAITITHLLAPLHLFQSIGISREQLMMPSPAQGEALSNFLSFNYLIPNLSGLHLVYGDIISLIVIACITVLMNSTSIELATERDADLNRELKAHGVANITSALAGGYAGNSSVSRSLVNHATGGSQRLSGFVVVAIALAVLTSKLDIIGLIPKFVLAGLLLQLGLKLVWDWGWLSGKKISRTDWVIVVSLLLITAWVGFIPALVFGILACCITFVANVTSQNIVTSQYDLSSRKSSIIRSDGDTKTIDDHGLLVKVLTLKGYLFFGSAYSLLEITKGLIKSHHVRLLILDMTLINGMDSSAEAITTKIRKSLSDMNIQCVLVTAVPRSIDLYSAQGWTIYEQIDDALIAGEELLISENPSGDQIIMRQWLDQICCGDKIASDKLSSLMEPVKIQENGVICRRGEPSETLFLIEKGPVGVYVKEGSGRYIRVRLFNDLTVAGEMGFIMNTPRTADLVAESGSKIWCIERKLYIKAIHECPELEGHILFYVINLLSERLNYSTKEIAILRGA